MLVFSESRDFANEGETPHPPFGHLLAQGCRPFFAEKEPLALFPGATNPKGKAFRFQKGFQVSWEGLSKVNYHTKKARVKLLC